MNRRSRLLVVSALAVSMLGSALAMAQSYKVDSVHSSVAFKILHNGVNHVYGTFAAPTGSVELTDAGGSIEVTVNVATVSSGNKGRDDHLRAADYFNAQQYPTITFKSSKITRNGDGTYSAEGELTLRGVTKPLTVPLTVSEEKQGMRGGTVRGVETTFTIKRSDFGMTSGIPAIGDEVTLMVSLQGGKQ